MTLTIPCFAQCWPPLWRPCGRAVEPWAAHGAKPAGSFGVCSHRQCREANGAPGECRHHLRAVPVALHRDCPAPSTPSKSRATTAHLQQHQCHPPLVCPAPAQLSLLFICIFFLPPRSILLCSQKLAECPLALSVYSIPLPAFLLGQSDLCEANLTVSLSAENLLGPHSYSHLPTRSPQAMPTSALISSHPPQSPATAQGVTTWH